jgi:hypothetical protein
VGEHAVAPRHSEAEGEVERQVVARGLVRGARAVPLVDGDLLTEGASDCWSAAPLLRSKSPQFPDLVDCCNPFADAETRMQSNAKAEPVPTSASASTASSTVRRCIM